MRKNKRNTIFIFFVFISLIYSQNVLAAIKLANIFTDNMVLQRNDEVPIWGWSEPHKQITIKTSWNNETYETKVDKDGAWKIKVKTPSAGGPYQVLFSGDGKDTLNNVLIGDVWFCGGQSNMVMPVKGFRNMPVLHANKIILNGKNPQIRLVTIRHTPASTPQNNVRMTGWSEATPSRVANFSAVAWCYGRMLQKHLGIPFGLINCSRSGSIVEEWMSSQALENFKDLKLKLYNHKRSSLYNGMLHPLIGFAIKGMVWYQGSSNMPESENYHLLFPAMVRQWRKEWGIGTFPFYYVQIAPYAYQNYKEKYASFNSAFLRDAQRKDLDSIPNSGMAILTDVGSYDIVHPPQKEIVGKRLGYIALHGTYGFKGIGYEGPLYDKLTVKDSVAIVYFKHSGNGLTSYYKPLQLFEVAGSDKRFYPAKASISGQTVKVYSPKVKHPVAVRYAFKNYVKGRLYNSYGLPASSFRTDNW